MIDKTENEIIQSWSTGIATPVVSICCIAYNVEKYIAEAIDSFLVQETKFAFEIIVGEDCGGDNTLDILNEYAEKYPKLIKIIANKVNLGITKNTIETINNAKGEYIALCDGDDYWIDKHKLQIQLNEMQKHPKCDISFHSAKKLINDELGQTISNHCERNMIFNISEVILGRGNFMPTSSLVFKKDIFLNLPAWYSQVPVQDYFLQILASLKGGALYINRTMSIYRKGHSESWSVSQKNFDTKVRYQTIVQPMFMLLNQELGKKYNHEIHTVVCKNIFGILRNKSFTLRDRQRYYRLVKDKLLLKQRFLWYKIFSKQVVRKYVNRLFREFRNLKFGA